MSYLVVQMSLCLNQSPGKTKQTILFGKNSQRLDNWQVQGQIFGISHKLGDFKPISTWHILQAGLFLIQ